MVASPTFRDGGVDLVIDPHAYSLAAVKKAAYRLAARFTAVLGEVSESTVSVRLTFPKVVTEEEASEAARIFFQEILDQDLREQIARETAPLRDVILAHAYSRTGLPSDEPT